MKEYHILLQLIFILCDPFILLKKFFASLNLKEYVPKIFLNSFISAERIIILFLSLQFSYFFIKGWLSISHVTLSLIIKQSHIPNSCSSKRSTPSLIRTGTCPISSFIKKDKPIFRYESCVKIKICNGTFLPQKYAVSMTTNVKNNSQRNSQ